MRDTITLKSGREIYVNCGIIGIDPNGYVSHGYDGGIDDAREGHKDPWSVEERQELADIMIHRWEVYRNVIATDPQARDDQDE